MPGLGRPALCVSVGRAPKGKCQLRQPGVPGAEGLTVVQRMVTIYWDSELKREEFCKCFRCLQRMSLDSGCMADTWVAHLL